MWRPSRFQISQCSQKLWNPVSSDYNSVTVCYSMRVIVPISAVSSSKNTEGSKKSAAYQWKQWDTQDIAMTRSRGLYDLLISQSTPWREDRDRYCGAHLPLIGMVREAAPCKDGSDECW